MAVAFQMQTSALDYSSYAGVIGVGRVTCGKIERNTPVIIVDGNGRVTRNGRVLDILGNMGARTCAGRRSGGRRYYLHHGHRWIRYLVTLRVLRIWPRPSACANAPDGAGGVDDLPSK